MLPELLNVMLSLAVFASAALCIVAGWRDNQPGVYLFKPLTMVFVLVIAVQRGPETESFYHYLVFAGLLFSLAGDVLLMLSDDRFQAGLASFLVGHLCYIAAFTSQVGFGGSLVTLAPFAVAAGAVAAYVLPGVGSQRAAVLAYVAVISVMGWQSLVRWLELGNLAAGLACGGAVLFVFSDSVLAINRFRTPFAAAQAVVLSSYFSAQWLIALSVGVGEALV